MASTSYDQIPPELLRLLDQELEARLLNPIPPALHRLLADLETLPPSIPIFNVDLTGDEFGGFFTSLEGSYRRQVRLRVFTAIGNCSSLWLIDLNPRLKTSVSSVTEAEATALFQGLQSNLVLQILDVSGWQGSGTAAACEALAGLVRSSRTLIRLSLRFIGLTGEGVGHIAAALQANTSSILQSLYVNGNGIGDAAGAQHLADILASTPTLEYLGMFDISMDAAAGEVIAKALAHNTSLRLLSMGWVGNATNPTNRSAALTRIVAALSAPVGAGAPNASAFNTHIKQLYLTVWTNDLEPIEAGLGEAVAHMLRSNATLEQLRISTSFVDHGLEALRYNTSITDLWVEHDRSCRKVDLDKLILIVQRCQTLQRLRYNNNHPREFKRQVFRSLKDNPSIKTLVMDGWEGLDDAMFKDLMESLQVNTNLEAISLEGTSWESEGKEATLLKALRGNRIAEVCYPDNNRKLGKSRGLALIVSMEKGRPGGAVDRGRLETLFRACGFDKVVVLVDLLACDSRTIINLVLEDNVLEEDECFVCSINGHGGTQDGKPYILDEEKSKIMVNLDIVDPFRQTEHLRGKPKVYLINACRVDTLCDKSDSVGAHTDGQQVTGSARPHDCLLVFSTSEGSPSCRHPVAGTVFVNQLMQTVMENKETTDVLSMMTMVNDRVNEAQIVGQCCEIKHTLRKKLYWKGV